MDRNAAGGTWRSFAILTTPALIPVAFALLLHAALYGTWKLVLVEAESNVSLAIGFVSELNQDPTADTRENRPVAPSYAVARVLGYSSAWLSWFQIMAANRIPVFQSSL